MKLFQMKEIAEIKAAKWFCEVGLIDKTPTYTL